MGFAPAFADKTVSSPRSTLRLPLGAFLALLGGCAVFPNAPATAAEQDPQTQPVDPSAADHGPQASSTASLPSASSQARYHVMVGEMAAGRQQPALAAEEFLKALETNPDAHLAARATSLAASAGREDLALQAARRWQQADPKSLDAREALARLALRAGKDEEAFSQCETIVRDHPGGVDDGLRHVALLLAQEPTHADAAMAVMDRVVAEYSSRPFAQTARALLAYKLGRDDAAEQSARAALRADPGSRDAATLLAGTLTRKDDIGEAAIVIDGLAKGAKSPQDAADLRLGFVKMLVEANQRDAARAQLETILTLVPSNSDARLALGLLAMQERRLDEAEAQFRVLAKSADKQNEGDYFLGRVYETRGQAQQALDEYEKVTGGDQTLDALVRRGTMLGRLNRIDEARQLFGQLRRQYPPLAEQFYSAEGEMLIDCGRPRDALDLYTAALKENPDSTELLYSRALTFDRLNKTAEAEQDLHTLLSASPGNARALNALGYMLTEHGERYDEARTLIAKALQLTPNDPAVMDSMGWVEFKLGHAKEALEFLQKAFGLFPDPEIAAHLGEVLWTTGDKDQARSVWNAVLKTAPNDPNVTATIKRLTQ